MRLNIKNILKRVVDSTLCVMTTLVIVQNLTADIPTRWRDLLFYIKKGANWSFPLRVEGIKSDFIRFMCETSYYMNPRRGKKNKKTAISDKKDLNLSAK